MKKQTIKDLASLISNHLIPNDPKGGFTLEPKTKRPPLFGSNEYFVSLNEYERRLTIPVQSQEVQIWLEKNHHALSFNRYVGGWFDDKTNEYILDISIPIIGRQEAIAFAQENTQDAIFWPHGNVTIPIKLQHQKSA